MKQQIKMAIHCLAKSKNYFRIKKELKESEMMPIEEAIKRAHYIKPVLRVFLNEYQTRLAWTKGNSLEESLYNCQDAIISNLPVQGEKIREITGYHHTGPNGEWQPSLLEIIQQFPKDLITTDNTTYAVEIYVPSFAVKDIYCKALDRHVSVLRIYKTQYPEEIKNQKVLYQTQEY